MGSKYTGGLFVNKNIKRTPPCLRKIPELYEGETYFVSFDGRTTHECILIDWFEGIVLIMLKGKVESVNIYELGANRSWAIANAVIEN
jgi:hypothetical protein